ncbi:PilW family protein [Vibrio sp. HB236076]|uniref:PilW family protein n=1 Tax=Vibrio sp. HB236076 TaxID=3232307 RepID=A0AB39HI11_9VIBR
MVNVTLRDQKGAKSLLTAIKRQRGLSFIELLMTLLIASLVILLASGFFVTFRQTMSTQWQALTLRQLIDKQVAVMADDLAHAGAQVQWSSTIASHWPIDIAEQGKQMTLFFQVSDEVNVWQQYIRYQQQGKQLKLCEWRQAISAPYSTQPQAPCYQIWDTSFIQVSELNIAAFTHQRGDTTVLELEISLTAALTAQPNAFYTRQRKVLVNNIILGQGG